MTNKRLLELLIYALNMCKTNEYRYGLCGILIRQCKVFEIPFVFDWLQKKGINIGKYNWYNDGYYKIDQKTWYAPRIEWLENQIKELKELEYDRN